MQVRMIVAIVFFILLIACGLFQEFYLDKIFSDFNKMLDEIGDTHDGYYNLDKIIEAQYWWHDKTRKMEYFLPHMPLYDITSNLGEFKGAVIADDYQSATAMLNRLKLSVHILEDMSTIRMGNIV